AARQGSAAGAALESGGAHVRPATDAVDAGAGIFGRPAVDAVFPDAIGVAAAGGYRPRHDWVDCAGRPALHGKVSVGPDRGSAAAAAARRGVRAAPWLDAAGAAWN